MDFPMNVLINILARLPRKDIYRSKCVCKTWLNLISDPYFTSFHARNSPFAIILRAQTKSFSLLELAGNGKFTHLPLSPKLPPQGSTTVIGSCDSSVFLLHRKQYINRVYMFNPVLGSCFQVTEDDPFSIDYGCVEYKVGYIPSNNTCKLFRKITSDSEYCTWYGLDSAEVLTVGVDKDWRKKDESLFHVLGKQQLLCLNGAFHWVSDDEKRVCTYDLLEEKNSNGAGIEVPHGVSSRGITLTILNRCLSVIDQPDDGTMVVWVMKEYGVVESWSKVAVMPLRDPYPKYRFARYFVPVAVFPNGNILCTEKFRKGVFIFSVEEKRWTQFKYPDREPTETLYVNTYEPRFCTATQGGS